jgi:thioredoxin 1
MNWRYYLIVLFCTIAFSFIGQEEEAKEFKNLSVDEYLKLSGGANSLVLVNFSADWCVVCKRQKPILDQLKKEQRSQFVLVEIDMEQNPLIAEHFEVDGLPVNIIYKNGVMVWNRIGFQTKQQLEEMLKAYWDWKK